MLAESLETALLQLNRMHLARMREEIMETPSSEAAVANADADDASYDFMDLRNADSVAESMAESAISASDLADMEDAAMSQIERCVAHINRVVEYRALCFAQSAEELRDNSATAPIEFGPDTWTRIVDARDRIRSRICAISGSAISGSANVGIDSTDMNVEDASALMNAEDTSALMNAEDTSAINTLIRAFGFGMALRDPETFNELPDREVVEKQFMVAFPAQIETWVESDSMWGVLEQMYYTAINIRAELAFEIRSFS